jgi:hypothetical protein
MGLNNTGGKITYLNMKQGKFARKNANGDIELYDSVEGIIKAVEFKDDEYNGTSFRKISITLVDGDEKYILQIRTDSGYYRGLTNSIANGDITKPVKLVASSKEVNGKPQTTIFVSQGGQALKWKWTKDNPGNLPPLETVKLKGRTVYDNTQQQAFFEGYWTTLLNTAVQIGDSADDLPF